MDTSGKTHCAWCGGRLSRIFIQGGWRLRCGDCGKVTYENPTAGVAGILFSPAGDVLLVRRARGMSREGRWCIPCGHVEYNEDIRHALVREMREEAGFWVVPGKVFSVYSNFHEPASHTTGTWFLTEPAGGFCESGDDASEAAFFPLDALPPLAFETDALVLEELRQSVLGIKESTCTNIFAPW